MKNIPLEKQLLYPCKRSLDEVISEGATKLPITNFNQLKSLLMCYHNTLLAQLEKEKTTSPKHRKGSLYYLI